MFKDGALSVPRMAQFLLSSRGVMFRHGKGVDAQLLSVKIFENYRNSWIVEDYSPVFSVEAIHIVEIFY